MEEIKKLLHDSGLASLRDAGITIVSIFGNSGFRSLSAYASGELTNIATTLANRIVGSSVFVSPNEVKLLVAESYSKQETDQVNEPSLGNLQSL